MSDIHALSGAYAVDALDQFERVAFERHLTGCQHCTAEVDGLREAASMITDLTLRQPPAGLREQVLADIAAVRPLPPLVNVVPVTSFGGSSRSRRTHRSAPRRGAIGLVAAAAVIAAVGVGVTVVDPFDDDSAPVATSATGDPLADAVLAAPDAEQVSSEIGGGASAVLVRSRQLDRAVIVTRGMADPGVGNVYELWFRGKDGNLLPAGLMPDGSDNTVVLDGNAAEATAVGITVEPATDLDDLPSSKPIVLEFEQA